MLLCAGCGFTASDVGDAGRSIDGPHELRGVIARWEMDEPSGDVVHDTGRGPALDLMIDDPSRVTWGAGALGITAPARIRSAGPASTIYDACRMSNRLTIEAWVTPDSGMQVGPARIATVSADGFERNLMLAQTNRRWVFRVRTSSTDGNGNPELVTPELIPLAARPRSHVVGVLDGNTRLIYVDGAEAARDAKGGTLQSWNAGFPVVIGNELVDDGSGPRHWLGEIERIVIYDRALTATEIHALYLLGPR